MLSEFLVQDGIRVAMDSACDLGSVQRIDFKYVSILVIPVSVLQVVFTFLISSLCTLAQNL